MFLEHYQLHEQPFGVTPDPRFLYMSETHREALAALFHGVHQGREFLALVAPPGMGKTSLLLRMMRNLEQTARTVFLFQTQCDSNEFLGYLLADMGLKAKDQDAQGMRAQLEQVWLENAGQGKKIVLVIDEAQGLDDHVLDTVYSLANGVCRGALQVVFAGQPQLAQKLGTPGMARLSDRIAIFRLKAFDATETRAYIAHRLQVAGVGQGLFTASAVERIAHHSLGIPRNINNICFNALSWGYAEKRSVIDADTIAEVVRDLDVASLTGTAAREDTEFVTSVGELDTVQSVAPVSASERAPEPAEVPAAKLSRSPEDISAVSAAAIETAMACAPSVGFPAAKHKATRSPVWLAVAAGILLVVGLGYGLYGRQPRSVPIPLADQTPSAVLAAAPDRRSAISTPATSGPAAGGGPAVMAMPAAAGTNASTPVRNADAGSRTVIVAPKQTISELCRLYLGRDDANTLKKISELNNLANPNHIEVGQRLILPRRSHPAGKHGADQESKSAIKRRGRE